MAEMAKPRKSPAQAGELIQIAGCDITVPISIVACTIETLPIDIVAQTIGNITIDIAAQSLGNIAVNIAASAVTLNVDIVAQTVQLNIKTFVGTNIIIDKLVQEAFTERRSTISNNGETANWTDATGTNRKGKFFPRGMRGFINTIDVYCKDAGATGGTISVYISPQPSMGYLYTADITVPAGGGADWRSATFNKMWNYDSMFIWILSSTSDMDFGYDSVEKPDGFISTDSAVIWTIDDNRYWLRVIMKGQTVGDVPISGTVNTIPIPSISDEHLYEAFDEIRYVETVMKTVHGAGKTEYLRFYTDAAVDSHQTWWRVYCDGKCVFSENYKNFHDWYGYAADTPKLSLLKYAVDDECVLHLTLKFSFKRELKITVTAKGTLPEWGQWAELEGIVNLQR